MLKVRPEYLVTEQDALAYVNGCFVVGASLLGSYGAAVAGLIPVWVLCIIVVLMLPRWMINLHELVHVYDQEQINPLICTMGISPAPLSLLTLSYGELRSLHMAHHLNTVTVADPDAFHIRGSLWQVLLASLSVPEQNTVRWIMAHGMTWRLGIDLAIKAAIFLLLAGIGGSIFFWFWLTLRLVYGVSDFAFSRLVHHRQGEYGTFALDWPMWVQRIVALLLGNLVLHATINHDLHHLNPCIAAHHFPEVRQVHSLSLGTSDFSN